MTNKFWIFFAIIMILTISCKNKSKEVAQEDKKAESLTELQKKYDNKEFKDCESFMKATDEMISVFLKTVDKAYNGDEEAKKELEKFDNFFSQFDKQADKFAIECPELFDKWSAENDKKIALASDKLVKIYNQDYDTLVWDDKIDKELQQQLDSLNELLKKAIQEDNQH